MDTDDSACAVTGISHATVTPLDSLLLLLILLEKFAPACRREEDTVNGAWAKGVLGGRRWRWSGLRRCKDGFGAASSGGGVMEYR